ncbi:MAG: hypothetical protein GF330_12085 [Candidatus Eisenbacteria bacterium]|nr:hypothetical protein [Candidatus Eisenbacteria bacterium]
MPSVQLRALLAAFLVALLLCAALRPLARRWGLLSARRAVRAGPGGVPLLGGAAILAGVAAGLLLAAPWLAATGLPPLLLSGAWLLALAFGLIGLADDWRSLPPIVRLGLEIACALLLLAVTALAVARAFEGRMVWSVLPWGALLVAAAANAFNLADNSDGTAAGAGALTFLGITLLLLPGAEFGAAPRPAPTPDLLGPLPAACAGALLGVLVWNRPPARIYLGDSGALASGALLGFALFWILLFLPSSAAHAGGRAISGLTGGNLLASLGLILGYLLFDPLYATVGRLLRGRRPWVGGVDHPAHDLQRWLGSRARAWIAILLMQAISVASGVAVARAGLPPAWLLPGLILWALFLPLAALWGGRPARR